MSRQKFFDSVQIKVPGSNTFDLSHEKKLTADMGYLVPILCQEVLPGDYWRNNMSIMARFQPLLAPIMHRVNVSVHNFYVPMDQIWNEFDDFITGGRLGTSAPVSPYITVSDANEEMFGIGQLSDYLGLPNFQTGTWGVGSAQVSALPFRAYQHIYNEYYRDQNLIAPIDFSLGSGDMTAEYLKLVTLRRSADEKDYFKSALPFAQRGPQVLVPMEGDVEWNYKVPAVGARSWPNLPPAPAAGNISLTAGSALQDSASNPITLDNIDDITFENATVTIADLRLAKSVQEFLELAARVGSRYVEYLRGFFGVISDDLRLDRPQYLGGGKAPMTISEVLSTVQQVSQEDPETPIGAPTGNMSGHGIMVGDQFGFREGFKYHGFVVSILRILPETGYMQGMSKMWGRTSNFDYYHPQFAHIGEQAIKLSELYADPAAPNTWNSTFGYQNRYSEYKYIPSTVHGNFKTNLDFWHMGIKFESAPSLNQSFIESNPTDRIFAVTDDVGNDQVLIRIAHNIRASRKIPYFTTPKF